MQQFNSYKKDNEQNIQNFRNLLKPIENFS